MSSKILRPVPTFEQVIRLPDPVVNLPERLIEVSRPDPNTFDEHFDALLKHNAAVMGHAAHAADTRMAATEFGVPMDVMRGVQGAAESAANSAQLQGNRPLGAPPGAAPGATPFDFSGRQNFIQELMRQNSDIQQQQFQAFRASLDAGLQQAAREAAAAAARSETARMHAASMQPFQDMHQQHAQAISQMIATQQQTAAAAAEMRTSNRDQRNFMRTNEEQMTRLMTILGQTQGATRGDLEQAAVFLANAQREQGMGIGALILEAGNRMSNALQQQATEISRLRPPAREVGAEAGTQTTPDLSAGTTPGSAASTDPFASIEARAIAEGRLRGVVHNPREAGAAASNIRDRTSVKEQSRSEASEKAKKNREDEQKRQRDEKKAKDKRAMNRDLDAPMPERAALAPPDRAAAARPSDRATLRPDRSRDRVESRRRAEEES